MDPQSSESGSRTQLPSFHAVHLLEPDSVHCNPLSVLSDLSSEKQTSQRPVSCFHCWKASFIKSPTLTEWKLSGKKCRRYHRERKKWRGIPINLDIPRHSFESALYHRAYMCHNIHSPHGRCLLHGGCCNYHRIDCSFSFLEVWEMAAEAGNHKHHKQAAWIMQGSTCTLSRKTFNTFKWLPPSRP